MRIVRTVMVSIVLLTCGAVVAQKAEGDSASRQPVLPRVTMQLPGGRAAAIPKGPYQTSWESII